MKRLAALASLVLLFLLVVYTGITLYDANMKVGRMWETHAVKPHEAPLLVMPAGIVPFNGGEAFYRNAAAEELQPPFSLNASETVAQGKLAYGYYCVQCHGKFHDGNGTVGQSFSPLPGDLRSERVQQLSDGLFFKEISYGIPNGRQPPLDTTLSVNERWQVIGYIKSLGPRQ
jgi:mono/diheme cytochrome c family protein